MVDSFPPYAAFCLHTFQLSEELLTAISRRAHLLVDLACAQDNAT
jgi:hypothetical protein